MQRRRYACLGSDKTIRLLRDVNAVEYDNFNNLANKFNNYILEADYYKIFNKAYDELIIGFKKFSENKGTSDEADLNRYIMNYLFSIRTFLDHWETRIKRKYNNNQEYIDLLKSATSHEYNNHMTYRIVYRLRNYVQHCEMPIAKVTRKLNENDEKELNVYLSRDRILSNFNEWKTEEIAYLKSLDEEFEILPYLKEMNTCLYNIHNKLLNFNVNEDFMLDCIKVLKLRKQFKEYEGTFTIAEYSEESFKKRDRIFTGNTTNINFIRLPDKLCESILKLHIKNNETYIKVFNFSGNCIGDTNKEFPYFVDNKDEASGLFVKGKELINVNGKNWVRLYETTLIGEINRYTSVYADSGFGIQELTKLSNFYKDICEVLYK